MELRKKAESLPKELRRQIIMDYLETDLHKFLKKLFQTMEPNYVVEITHGPQEFGKDLVIVKSDGFTEEVIGVVVKRGDIKGKTLGDVDDLKLRAQTVLSRNTEKKIEEIRSQIKQALSHPAKMKSILEDLPVSKVYVMLAGELSRNARERLTNEIEPQVDIFDIEWLISKFTEFYPQIFFKGQIVDFLQKKYGELEENHSQGKSGKNLSEYFIDPLIRPLGIPHEFDEDNLRSVLKKRKFPFLNLLKISPQQRKKLILLGDPGTGKTGAMAKLAIDVYKSAYTHLVKTSRKFDQKVPVPVLFTARQFLALESPEDFLVEYFESEEAKSCFEVDVVLVDGLDEIEPNNRRTVIDKLDAFSEEIEVSYILTSRKIDILNTLPEKYEKYELLPFEFNQSLELLSRFITDHDRLMAVKENLEKIQSQILLVPLSLLLLVELVEEHKEVPASVTELYDRFFDIALGRDDREKQIEVLFDYLIKKKFLGTLAYREFREKNRLVVPHEEFKQFLDSYAQEYQWSTEKLDDFVQEIERTGIIDKREEVVFKHRSFLDYFVAFYIYENRENIENLSDVIVDTYFDDIWGETAFFYIGLRRVVSQILLEKIYSYAAKGLNSDICKLMGVRLLQAGWHSPPEQHMYGIKNAIGYAPSVREKFREMIAASGSNISNIVSDFIVLTFGEFSFGSTFLERYVKDLFKELVDSKSQDDIYMAIVLSWSIRRFLEPKEIEVNRDAILDSLVSLPQMEKGRILLIMAATEEDRKIQKPIRRQIGRLKRKSPEVFKALVPAKRKGFR